MAHQSVILALLLLLAGGAFAWELARAMPGGTGPMGDDYGAFLPWMVSGFFWQKVNGLFSVPEFIPSFCAGVPLAFNPQSVFFSLPQQLLWVMTPRASLLVSSCSMAAVGAGSMFTLLRQRFQVSAPAATLAAVLFLLNGFFTSRMMIGHLAFHSFMLTPAVALAAMPASEETGIRRLTVRVVALALLVSYVFYSGGVYVLATLPLAAGYLVLLGAACGRWHRNTPTVVLCGLALTAGLIAYRLLPALAYTGNVPRPTALWMFRSGPQLIAQAFAGLFAPELIEVADPQIKPLWHELDFSVGVVPLLLAGYGFLAWRRRARRRGAWLGVGSARAAGMALCTLLLVPLMLSWDQFGIRSLLLHVPVVKSMSIMPRFLSTYIPFACALSALVVEQLPALPQRKLQAVALGTGLAILQFVVADRSRLIDRNYDPQPVAGAYARVQTREPIPNIERVETVAGPIRARNGGFVSGASFLPCYEPMFGYDNERFRLGAIRPGSVFAQTEEGLNFKNPACYVFPEANGCRPGDTFTAAQRPQLERFVAYQPFDFRWPTWEYAAAATSAVSFGLCFVVLAAEGFMWLRRRGDRVPLWGLPRRLDIVPRADQW